MSKGPKSDGDQGVSRRGLLEKGGACGRSGNIGGRGANCACTILGCRTGL